MKNKATKKIALINSPLLKKGPRHPFFPPLGLAYMAAILEQNNFEVKIYDCPVCEMDHNQLGKELSSFNPNIVGITSMTPTIYSALESARIAKATCPESKVVMGGPHVTFLDKETLAQEPAIDIIVRGEGEETFLEIAKKTPKLEKMEEIKGITFKSNSAYKRTPQRNFIADLDSLPRPAFEHLPLDRYLIKGRKILPIMSSRGCPFQCSFCVASQMFGAGYRSRKPKNVIEELEWLRDKYGAEGISFHDDTLTLDKNRITEICDLIINKNIKLPWGCGTRADQVNKEILQKMSKANCHEMCFGVESGCQKIRDSLKKKVTTEQCEKAIKWAKDAGIFVTMSVILGYPGETRETIKKTLDLVRKAEPDDVWLCLATPYPGTELRALVESVGWKMSEDWTKYNTMNPIFEDPQLPAQEISKMRKTFYDKFYSPKYIIKQSIKGYLKGNLYSKVMARTAINYNLWRIMSKI